MRSCAWCLGHFTILFCCWLLFGSSIALYLANSCFIFCCGWCTVIVWILAPFRPFGVSKMPNIIRWYVGTHIFQTFGMKLSYCSGSNILVWVWKLFQNTRASFYNVLDCSRDCSRGSTIDSLVAQQDVGPTRGRRLFRYSSNRQNRDGDGKR